LSLTFVRADLAHIGVTEIDIAQANREEALEGKFDYMPSKSSLTSYRADIDDTVEAGMEITQSDGEEALEGEFEYWSPELTLTFVSSRLEG
jgi:hypothetical protein